LSGVEKVFKPLKIYIHFLASFFIFSDDRLMTDKGVEPLAVYDIIDEIIIGDFPLSRIK
jgi:hypothetical protein